NSKTREVLNILHSKSFDIICIQETHLTNLNQSYLQLIWNNKPIYFNHHTNNSAGIAILINNNKNISITQVSNIIPGRCTSISFTWDDNDYTLYNIYSPTSSSGNQQQFFRNLFTSIIAEKDNNLIICGDWNTALNPNLDRTLYTGSPASSRDPCSAMITEFMQR